MDFPFVDRIVIDPVVMGGKPCLKGTRVTVGTITGLLASGASTEDVLALYPYLVIDDLRAALSYATWRSEERFVELDQAG